jgi:hypothetical protein
VELDEGRSAASPKVGIGCPLVGDATSAPAFVNVFRRAQRFL